jgi:hypothetical protein
MLVLRADHRGDQESRLSIVRSDNLRHATDGCRGTGEGAWDPFCSSGRHRRQSGRVLLGSWAEPGNAPGRGFGPGTVTVEVLYVDGCPNHEPSVRRVRAALDELSLSADVAAVRVTDTESALALRFLGSPSIRVNGVDVEPAARSAAEFGLTCRTYVDGSARTGIPPVEAIRRAIIEAYRTAID